MKFLAYSAGGGLVMGLFVLIALHGNTEVQVISHPPQKPTSAVQFEKIPLVIYSEETCDAVQ